MGWSILIPSHIYTSYPKVFGFAWISWVDQGGVEGRVPTAQPRGYTTGTLAYYKAYSIHDMREILSAS